MLSRLPIGVKVFIAPAIIIALMVGVIVFSQSALQRQRAAFLEVVGGSLTTSTQTTQLLLAVAEMQSDMLRYTQLRIRLPADDSVLIDLRRSIIDKYQRIDALFERLKSVSSQAESDAVSNISDFLTIHRAVSLKILEGGQVTSMAVSTLMAHYQQLQSYIVELATRSLESAQTAERQTTEYIENFSFQLIAASFAIVVISIILTFYIGRAISKPITQMIAVMDSIASGQVDAVVPGMQRRDEIGAMARAVGVFANVSKQLRDRERSLVEARSLAEDASKHKSQFLANMSHELRTPLNAILGYTELMLDNIYGEPPNKMQAVLQRVQSNGKHLLGLINDVLDLSKIEAGQFTLAIVDYSIKEIVHTVFTTLEALAAEKKLELRVELPPNLPRARGDDRRLTQALLNLVGNAIKFTDSGTVTISASVHNGNYTLSVRDTGPGIAEADQAKIFQEFQQADSSATKKKGGTGLGLAIAKNIVEMHGGEIGIHSVLGQGATFYFTVPILARQHSAAA